MAEFRGPRAGQADRCADRFVRGPGPMEQPHHRLPPDPVGWDVVDPNVADCDEHAAAAVNGGAARVGASAMLVAVVAAQARLLYEQLWGDFLVEEEEEGCLVLFVGLDLHGPSSAQLQPPHPPLRPEWMTARAVGAIVRPLRRELREERACGVRVDGARDLQVQQEATRAALARVVLRASSLLVER